VRSYFQKYYNWFNMVDLLLSLVKNYIQVHRLEHLQQHYLNDLLYPIWIVWRSKSQLQQTTY
jgi:acyl-ACP thioesterase